MTADALNEVKQDLFVKGFKIPMKKLDRLIRKNSGSKISPSTNNSWSRFLTIIDQTTKRESSESFRSKSMVEYLQPNEFVFPLPQRSISDSEITVSVINDKVSPKAVVSPREDETVPEDIALPAESSKNSEVNEERNPSADNRESKMFHQLKCDIDENLQYSFKNDFKDFEGKIKYLLKGRSIKIRTKLSLLLTELIPRLGHDLDTLFSKVLPFVINNLSQTEENLHTASKELLHLYSSLTKEKERFLKTLINTGLRSSDANVRLESVQSVPYMLTEEFLHIDLFNIVQELVSIFDNYPECETAVKKALTRLMYLTGPDEFTRYRTLLNSNDRRVMTQLQRELTDEQSWSSDEEREVDEETIVKIGYEDNEMLKEEQQNFPPRKKKPKRFSSINDIIVNKLMNENDLHSRRQGCDELIQLLEETPSVESLFPHLDSLLTFLTSLQNDSNFSIATISLRCISIFISKASTNLLDTYLTPIIHSISRLFDDERLIVRSEAGNIFLKLLKRISPDKVLSDLCLQDLHHRSSRVRENCLNLITAALLTFPSDFFNLELLSMNLVPSLSDSKRRVRQASLECVATIAQEMGKENNIVLMEEIEVLEETTKGNGVTLAVQARLNRRTLPKLTADGLVQYSIPGTTFLRRGLNSSMKGLDVDWIMAGSGVVSSGSVIGTSQALLSSSFGPEQTLAELDSRDLSSSLPQHLLLGALKGRDPMGENGLQRKRSYSEATLAEMGNEEDRSPLALWSAEPIDLSRTAPDFGNYRGVYLGKLRQGSALSRSINVDKSYTLLPNKYASGGVGSARNTDRGVNGSPTRTSPAPRKLHSLEPLDQVENSLQCIGLGTQARIPPLRSAAKSGGVRRLATSSRRKENEDDNTFTEEAEEEDVEEQQEEEEETEEQKRSSTVKRSSAGTRDSGISVHSEHSDEVIDEEITGSMSREGTSKSSSASLIISSAKIRKDLEESEDEGENEEPLVSEESAEENSEDTEDEKEAEDKFDEHSGGRNSHDGTKGGLTIRGGRVRRSSTNSLPTDLEFKKPNLNINGRAMYPHGPVKKKANTKTSRKPTKNFSSFDYESDFESDEEENIAISNATLTKLKILKKKRDSMKELEKKLTAEEAKKERLRKYRELELRHSGNSLQITNHKATDAKGRPTKSKPSPRPSPFRSKVPIPKSKSQDKNLNQRLSPSEPLLRPHSLDRSEGVTKKPFSRAPIQNVKKPIRNVKAKTLTATLPSSYTDSIGSRRSTPGMGLDRNYDSKGVSFSKSPTFGSYSPTSNFPTGSLSSQYLTASESNLANLNKLALNVHQPTENLTLEDLLMKSRRKLVKNYSDTNQNTKEIRQSLTPLGFRTQPKTPVRNVPQMIVPPKDNKLYFEVKVNTPSSLGSKPKLKKPVLPSSRLTTVNSSIPSSSPSRTPLSEDAIESVAFQSNNNYSSIQNKNFKPYPSGRSALESGVELLKSSEWEDQLEGIITMGRLAAFHSELLTGGNLKEITALLMKQAKNLRSQVCRAAIQVIMMFFDFLRKAMEPDLDKIVNLLLSKTSDTNKFLKEDSNSSLDMIIEVISPPKAIASVINEGINNRNATIKAAVARLLAYSAERLTAAKVLSQREVAEKLLPAVVKLAQEGSFEARRYAKISLQRLATQPDFEAALKKYVASSEIMNIQKILDNINKEKYGIQDSSRVKAEKGGRYRR